MAGARAGFGTLTSEGTTYTGKFQDGKKHGRGKLTLSDGRTYDGEFLDD